MILTLSLLTFIVLGIYTCYNFLYNKNLNLIDVMCMSSEMWAYINDLGFLIVYKPINNIIGICKLISLMSGELYNFTLEEKNLKFAK